MNDAVFHFIAPNFPAQGPAFRFLWLLQQLHLCGHDPCLLTVPFLCLTPDHPVPSACHTLPRACKAGLLFPSCPAGVRSAFSKRSSRVSALSVPLTAGQPCSLFLCHVALFQQMASRRPGTFSVLLSVASLGPWVVLAQITAQLMFPEWMNKDIHSLMQKGLLSTHHSGYCGARGGSTLLPPPLVARRPSV